MGMLDVGNVTKIVTTLAGILRNAYNANTASTITFEGASGALNDMSLTDAGYAGLRPSETIIRIAEEGTPDTFKSSIDDGATWSSAVNITGAEQTITGGSGVEFAATTGHALGSTWRFTNSPAIGAEHLRLYVAALTDPDIINDVFASVYAAGKKPQNSWATYKSEASTILNAIKTNVGGDLDAFLTTNTLRVHHEILDLMSTISPANVIPPKTILGEFEYSGDAAGTWTPWDSVDVNNYYGGQVEVIALSSITGAGAGPATITGKDFDDADINISTPAVFGALTQNEVYDLSSDHADYFKSISAVTVTGGATGEKFIIQTKEDRTTLL